LLYNVLVKHEQLAKNLINCNIQVSATVKQASGTDYSLEIDLAHPINPDKCSFKALPSKVSEVILLICKSKRDIRI
jgi:hypothetical protein